MVVWKCSPSSSHNPEDLPCAVRLMVTPGDISGRLECSRARACASRLNLRENFIQLLSHCAVCRCSRRVVPAAAPKAGRECAPDPVRSPTCRHWPGRNRIACCNLPDRVPIRRAVSAAIGLPVESTRRPFEALRTAEICRYQRYKWRYKGYLISNADTHQGGKNVTVLLASRAGPRS